MLYVDNPVGTGFSFTKKNECYATNQNMVREREDQQYRIVLKKKP